MPWLPSQSKHGRSKNKMKGRKKGSQYKGSKEAQGRHKGLQAVGFRPDISRVTEGLHAGSPLYDSVLGGHVK